ncbi:hypothetical protein SAMN02745121_05000 [Nannocystis exedens]|uniref:Lipoprotein n=1 Tax=Nannocystis exedens TaxID=54 RepID=A0A1I2CA16_9BACT|nr:hypothetical protein [Nannocystis exedens]SFE65181.1 hypothetical protein SAMN02745121_05000 [Nannocystis exedens]
MTASTLSVRVMIVASAALAACPGDPGASMAEPADSATTSSGAASLGGDDDAGATSVDVPVPEDRPGAEPQTRVERLLAALDEAMYRCPERAWPDVAVNYRQRQVVLTSVPDNLAWVWNDQSGDGAPPVVTERQLDELPPEWTAYFNVSELDGVKSLGISLDQTQAQNEWWLSHGGTLWPDFAASLMFHEGFHFLSDQDDWNEGMGSRSAPYPEPWEPRYLRRQLIQALAAEVQAEGAGLAAAAHWYGRLQSEYAAEMKAIRSYDCTEGSAEYVSLIMSAIAELGCDAPDSEVLALALSHLPDGLFLSDGAQFDSDLEPYELGVVAGLLLRRAGVAGWELAVEQGAAPADQLLGEVAGAPQPDDPATQAAAQAAVAERNKSVGAQIEPMLARMKDPAYTRVAVRFDWIAGSFGVGGFYYLAADPQQSEVLLNFSAMLSPPSMVTIEVAEQTALAGVATPCAFPEPYSIVLTVPNAALTVALGAATSTDANVAFAGLAVEPTTGADNLPWLCPIDAGGANAAPAPPPDLHTLRHAGEGPRQAFVHPESAR